MKKIVGFNSSDSSAKLHQGLVLVFTGDGKGKTSAALGVVIRALGQGFRVYIGFFLKGEYPYGEREILRKLPNVTLASFGRKEFVDPSNIEQQDTELAKQALKSAHEAMLSGKYDLVVLDEVNVAVGWKMVALDDVVRLIKEKPSNVNLILTGRRADSEIVKMADLVTEMVKIKHPFDTGIPARKGIDY